MTGAHASATAIGQAHAAGSATVSFRRAQIATARPRSTAVAAAKRGNVTAAMVANTGPLNLTRSTTFGTAPNGTVPSDAKGRYNAISSSVATTMSRVLTRPMNSGATTIGKSFVAIAST